MMIKTNNEKIDINGNKANKRIKILKKTIPNCFTGYGNEDAVSVYCSLVLNDGIINSRSFKNRDEFIQKCEDKKFKKIVIELNRYKEKFNIVHSAEKIFTNIRYYEKIFDGMIDTLLDELSQKIEIIIKKEA